MSLQKKEGWVFQCSAYDCVGYLTVSCHADGSYKDGGVRVYWSDSCDKDYDVFQVVGGVLVHRFEPDCTVKLETWNDGTWVTFDASKAARMEALLQKWLENPPTL